MSAPFKTVALFGKQQSEGVAQTLGEIGAFLDQRGFRVLIEAGIAGAVGRGDVDAADAGRIGEEADLAVIVGGDGTMLGIARELARFNMPLVGINQGRLGFITDVPIGEYARALAPMIAGDFEEERRTMLTGVVWRDDERIFEGFAVNAWTWCWLRPVCQRSRC